MNNQELKERIDQYLSGTLEPTEAAQLEAWLDAMGDEQAFDALPAEDKEIARREGYSRLVARIQQAPTIAKIRCLPRYWKLAACAACLVVALIIYQNNLLNILAPHRLTAMSSQTGKVKKHILSDGSIVWLKNSSRLVFPVAFGNGERVVTLEGEALFEIAKDPAHPFLIHCGSLTTTVLGTSFNICNTGAETKVTVLTGKVALTAPQSEKIILYPDQQAVYSEQAAAMEKREAGKVPLQSITKDTEYDMAFNDAPMQSVVQRIEKKFEVIIQLQQTTINDNLITADLTDQSLQHTMRMISQALNLDFEIKGEIILLTQKK